MPPEEIKRLRARLGLTQQELAHELGVAVRSVSRWETGEGEPSRLARRQLEQLAPKKKRRRRQK